MTWNARSVPSGGCNGGGAARRGMHRAYLFRQGHEQARGGCIDATTTLVHRACLFRLGHGWARKGCINTTTTITYEIKILTGNTR